MNNIAFACALQLSDPTDCVDLLLSTDRAPEAALFARTFAPSQTSKAVKSWRKMLEQQKKTKIAGGLADPAEHVDEFGGAESWAEGLERERLGPQEELIEEEPEQQYEYEPEPEHEREQQAQYAEEETHGLNGGVEGLSLGAEQHEEEQQYVPHQAEESLREFCIISSRRFSR